MGVTPQYISGIIREKGSASISVLSNIAKELNVPLASLFDDYKSEVKITGNAPTILCPHCHQPIELEVKERKDIGDVRNAGNSGGLGDAENV